MDTNETSTRRGSIIKAALKVLLTILLVAVMLPALPATQAYAATTLSSITGVSRSALVNHLSSHEWDNYYIGTPYMPYWHANPNGNPWFTKPFGTPGMNCVGFIYAAFKGAGMWSDFDAFFKQPFVQGCEYYDFDTKSQMLASGVLEKGDIIIAWDLNYASRDAQRWNGGYYGDMSDFSHMMIFWGNSSSQDLAWHSHSDYSNGIFNTWPGNEKTYIQGKSGWVNWTVLKLEPKVYGAINLMKSSGDTSITDGNPCYSLAGAVYDVYNSSWNWVGSITTDAQGKGSLGGLELGTYYVQEVTPPPGYLSDPTRYTVTTSYGSPAQTVYSTDQPNGDPFLVMLQKVDAETGGTYGAGELPQGSGSLAGAEFTVRYYQGLYSSVAAAQAVTPARTWVIGTDDDGYAALSLFLRGDSLYYNPIGDPIIPFGTITIVETKASSGYRLPQPGDANYKVFLTRYVPDASAPYGVRVEGDGNAISQGNPPKQREPVIRGDIEITKYVKDHKDDSVAVTGTNTPESGVVFDFYASRDFSGTTPNPGKVPAFSLTTDAKGYASTKNLYLIQNQDGTYTTKSRPAGASGALPADSYLCVQKTSWTGWEKCDPFVYTVGDNGVTVPAVRYDPVIPAAIRIIKLDSETGLEVPYPANWQIYSEQTKSYVRMKVDSTTTNIFSSDAKGQLLLPEQLPYGSYELRELTAPKGYILNKQAVKFSVTEHYDFDAPLIITFSDAPAKGTISIHKVAASTKTDLRGAEYAIIAATDIYTPDGTLRYVKGATVERITTDAAGKATSGPHYLGSYILKETVAPDGYQRDKTEHPVALTYAGQTVELVRAQLELVDDEVSVEAFKYDLDTLKAVPDTEFKLWRESAPGLGKWTLVGTQVSGADGKVTFKPVVRGSYKLVESRPNPLYASCEDSGQEGTKYFTIDEGSTRIILSYYNKKLVRGDIEIKKYIAEHKPDSTAPSGIVSPEAFVTFDFYASRDYIGLIPKLRAVPAFSLTTDVNGYASTKTANIYLTQNANGTYTVTKRPAVTDGGLPGDTYLCVQRNSQPGYDKAAPFVLAIDSLGVVRSKTLYDQPVSAYIRVVKLDSETGREVPYPASWQIYSKQTKAYVKMKLGGTAGVGAGTGMTDIFTSDAKGKLVLPEPLPYGDYLLHEFAAPHSGGRGYLQNTTDLPFSVTQGTSASSPLVIIMKDAPAKGRITLEKHDADSDAAVKGAAYTIFADEDIYTLDGTLRYAKGTSVEVIITGVDGKAASGALHLGRYVVKETRRPDGYQLDLVSHKVTLTHKDQVTALVLAGLAVKDRPVKVTAEKRNKDTGEAVPDTEFTLYRESASGAGDWKQVIRAVTGADGKATFGYVKDGSYKLTETRTNPLYASCEDSGELGTRYFVIDGQSTHLTFTYYNKKLVRGDIEIKKYIAEHKPDSTAPSGIVSPEAFVTFDFYASRDYTGLIPKLGAQPAFSLTTDITGYASTEAADIYLTQNDDGTYTITKRPAVTDGGLPADTYLCVQRDGYPEYDKAAPFVLAIDSLGVIRSKTLYDQPVSAYIRVIKLDSETGLEVPYPATWQIYSEQTKGYVSMTTGGTVGAGTTDSFTSDTKGKLVLPEPLPYGDYLLHEVEAPHEGTRGYLRNTADVPFSVAKSTLASSPLVIVMEDAPAKGRITLEKHDADSGAVVGGAVYTIFADEDIYTLDGTLRHATGDAVADITTDADGRAASTPLHLGRYSVLESGRPDGYQLDLIAHKVSLEYADQVTELVLTGVAVKDRPVKVTAEKRDKGTDEVVPDTEFTLYRESVAGAGDWVQVARVVTGADGRATFEYVKDGSYKLTETRTNPLYASCEDSGESGTRYFVIDDQATHLTFTYYNIRPIRGDIELVKYMQEHGSDSTTLTGNVLPEVGVIFDFFASRDFDGLKPLEGAVPAFSLETDGNGFASTKAAGIYLIQNDDGTYTLNDRPAVTDGALPEDSYLCAQRTTDPAFEKAAPFVVAIDSRAVLRSVTLNDPPVSAFIKVVKLDSETGLEVPYPATWQIWSEQTRSFVSMKVGNAVSGETGNAAGGEAGVGMADSFTSDATGLLILPEPLPYGDYLLHEVAAPHEGMRGYLQNTTDVPFSVTQSHTGDDPLVVSMEDAPAKGQITLRKRDAVSDEPVEGATYTIFADEDIYTLDGTLRHVAGDAVTDITTDADGRAASAPLHLGRYSVKETGRPDGYHMDLDTHTVLLEYADQTTALVLVRLELTDEPQKVTGEKKDKDTDAPVPDTEFTLYRESVPGVGDWVRVAQAVTGADGKISFSQVIAGSYKLAETRPNPDYASCEESGEVGTRYFVIDEDSTDEVQVFYNTKIQLACETYKDTINITSAAFKTFDEDHVQINNIGKETYEYLLGFRSLANVRADEYTVVDEMENAQSGQVVLVSLTTPVPYGDSDGTFNLWYRTNMTDPKTLYSDANALVGNPANPLNPLNKPLRSSLGWRLWARGLPTTSPTTLTVAALGLSDGEYITGVRYEYGSVEVGFATDNGAVGFTQLDRAGLHWMSPAPASAGEMRSVPVGGEGADVEAGAEVGAGADLEAGAEADWGADAGIDAGVDLWAEAETEGAAVGANDAADGNGAVGANDAADGDGAAGTNDAADGVDGAVSGDGTADGANGTADGSGTAGVDSQAFEFALAPPPVAFQPARYEVAARHAILPPEDIRSSVNVFIARNLTLTDTDEDAVVTTVVEPFMVQPAEEVPYPGSRDSQIPNKLPQTGDQLTLLLLGMAAVLAGIGIAILAVKKVRDRKRRNGAAGGIASGVASEAVGGARGGAADKGVGGTAGGIADEAGSEQ